MSTSDESPLRFPCDFPIKVMGVSDPNFREMVVERVRRHAPDLDEEMIQVRASRAGRYQSVTVVIHARNRAQLDAIYEELSAHPSVKMAL